MLKKRTLILALVLLALVLSASLVDAKRKGKKRKSKKARGVAGDQGGSSIPKSKYGSPDDVEVVDLTGMDEGRADAAHSGDEEEEDEAAREAKLIIGYEPWDEDNVDMRPVLFEDEVLDEDDVENVNKVGRKCEEIIDNLNQEYALRIWGSFFSMDGPWIELPTGRRIEGTEKVERYLQELSYNGIKSFQYNLTAPVTVTERTCSFSRIVSWTQFECTFLQPGITVMHFKYTEYGLEMYGWQDYWDVDDMAQQYRSCAKENRKKGIKRAIKKPLPARKNLKFTFEDHGDAEPPSELLDRAQPWQRDEL